MMEQEGEDEGRNDDEKGTMMTKDGKMMKR
jgi:hypothetical protein